MVTRYCYLVALFLSSCFTAGVALADPLSESLIYHAYFSGAAEVQRLLDKGANPNSRDEHGWTALAIASDRSDPQATPIAAALIAKGADVNAAVGHFYPVVNAILNKNASLVALLMAKEVNLRVTDAKGNSLMALARKMGQPEIIYYLDKKMFEEAQTMAYLTSALHLQQITTKFVMANCQYQYWSFYLKSEQDNNMDKPALERRIADNARIVSEMASVGARYFPAYQDGKATQLAQATRDIVFQQLNDMISNRNRRENGVGKESDMQKRCGEILAKTQQNIAGVGVH